MRLDLLKPQGGYTPEVVGNALSLVGAKFPMFMITSWTKNERALVYDWAMREHFSASDNKIARREKPYLVGIAAVAVIMLQAQHN
jgi:hypothetical protein